MSATRRLDVLSAVGVVCCLIGCVLVFRGCAAAKSDGVAQAGVANVAVTQAPTSGPAQVGALNAAHAVDVAPASRPVAGNSTGDATQQGAANLSAQGNTGLSYTSQIGLGAVVLVLVCMLTIVAVTRSSHMTIRYMADQLQRSVPTGSVGGNGK